MSCAASRSRNAGSSSGSVGPSPPRGRVVGEHLDRGRPDLGRAVRGLHHAVAEREVGADPPAVREHPPKSIRGTWPAAAVLDWRGWTRRLLGGLRALVDATRLRIIARLVAKPADCGDARGRAAPAAARRSGATSASWSLRASSRSARTRRARSAPGSTGWGSLAGRSLRWRRRHPAVRSGTEGEWPHEGESSCATRSPAWTSHATTRRSSAPTSSTAGSRRSRRRRKKRLVILRFLLERVFTEDRAVPGEGGQPAAGAVPPGRRRAPPLPVRRAASWTVTHGIYAGRSLDRRCRTGRLAAGRSSSPAASVARTRRRRPAR